MQKNEKPVLSLRVHNMRVIAEAKSPLNLWATGEEVKHSPDLGHHRDRNKLVLHYIEHGGIARLEREHRIMEGNWAWAVFMGVVCWWRQRAPLLLRKGITSLPNLR